MLTLGDSAPLLPSAQDAQTWTTLLVGLQERFTTTAFILAGIAVDVLTRNRRNRESGAEVGKKEQRGQKQRGLGKQRGQCKIQNSKLKTL